MRKVSQNSQRNNCAAVSLFNTVKSLHAVRIATLLKTDPLTGVSGLAVSRSSRKWMFLNNSKTLKESTCLRVSFKIIFRSKCSQMLLKIIAFTDCKFHRKAPVLQSSLITLQALRTATLLKRDSNTGFSREFFELFKNTYFV